MRKVFVAECYAPTSAADAAVAAEVRASCANLRTAGADVAYLGSLIVADDELAFHVFTAADADDVQEACRRAGLRVERVTRAETIGFGKPPTIRRQSLAQPA